MSILPMKNHGKIMGHPHHEHTVHLICILLSTWFLIGNNMLIYNATPLYYRTRIFVVFLIKIVLILPYGN